MRSGLDKVFEHLQSSLSGAKRVRARIIRQQLRQKVSINRALPVDLRKRKPPQVAPATLQDINKLAPYVQNDRAAYPAEREGTIAKAYSIGQQRPQSKPPLQTKSRANDARRRVFSWLFSPSRISPPRSLETVSR